MVGIMYWTSFVVTLLFSIQNTHSVDLTKNDGATGLEVVTLRSVFLWHLFISILHTVSVMSCKMQKVTIQSWVSLTPLKATHQNSCINTSRLSG